LNARPTNFMDSREHMTDYLHKKEANLGTGKPTDKEIYIAK